MFGIKDIVENGKNAEKFLAKYPYAAVFEKKYSIAAAGIGKLAEKGYISVIKTITDEEWSAICDEVEKEAADIRKKGTY